MKERIEARIAELERKREEFLQMANRQVAAFEAAIKELSLLLEPQEDEPESLSE